MIIDHVALVARHLESTLDKIAPHNAHAGPIEDFPGEGTREVYLGAGQQAALLLMQPTSDEGPYARALKKRGPGLHHLAIHVPALETYIASLEGSGWYLLPQSLATIAQSRTVWLARPGVGVLVEVAESTSKRSAPALVGHIEVPATHPREGLFEAVGLAEVGYSKDEFAWITVGGTRYRADRIAG